jgi:NAD(P)-dependent dehydrogenase (short-subunit alcohol dehydrogenase family)
VILCSRSVSAGEKAIKDEIEQMGEGGYVADSGNIVVKALDLTSLASVKAFAEEFKATEKRLDLLVLNAGIMALPRRETTDAGFEKQIGVNHFGHAYLTQLLLASLDCPDTLGRVVVLSSSAHTMGRVVPSDLHYTQGRAYSGWEAYGQSKLANLLFAKGLADSLSAKTHITAVSVHPGVIQTNLWRQSTLNRIVGCVVTSKSIPQGAATTVWACVAPRVGTDALRGAYLEDCRVSVPSTAGLDSDKKLRAALWAATEEQLREAVSKAGLA